MRHREPATKADIKIRMTEPLRADIEASAMAKGISMNAEMVDRLGRSYEKEALLEPALELAYGRQAAGLMLMLGEALNRAGRLGALIATRSPEGMDQWLSNAPAFDQACKAAVLVLEGLRPTGDVEFPKATGPSLRAINPETLGNTTAASVLFAAKDPEGVNRGLPPEEQNLDREQRGRRAHALLGPASANIQIPARKQQQEKPQGSGEQR